VRDQFSSDLASGDREAAVGKFVDFWSGAGSWQKMPLAARADVLGMTAKLALDWQASFAADPGPDCLSVLANRTLLVRGDKSPEPMRVLVDALHDLMPGSTRIVVRGANHLLPLTHMPDLVGIVAAHLHAAAERELR